MSTDMIAERLESLKAGLIAGFCVACSFVITTLVNSFVLARYFEPLKNFYIDIDILSWHWLVSGSITSFAGFLFGVTYRYIIRDDKNLQLKAGGVFAFALVRGLAQIEVGLSCGCSILPFVVLGSEGILWFGLAAIALDGAMQLDGIKPLK